MSSTVQTPRAEQAIHPEVICFPQAQITFPAHAGWHITIPDIHMDIRLSYGEKLTWAARAACSRWRAVIDRRAVGNLTHLDCRGRSPVEPPPVILGHVTPPRVDYVLT